MSSFRTRDARAQSTWTEIEGPPFRKIFFTDNAKAFATSSNLREAWTAVPGLDTSVDGLTSWLAARPGGIQLSEEVKASTRTTRLVSPTGLYSYSHRTSYQGYGFGTSEQRDSQTQKHNLTQAILQSQNQIQSHIHNSDMENVESPWRMQIYIFWNYIFSCAAAYLNQTTPGIPQFYTPNYDKLVLSFPCGEFYLFRTKVWQSGALVLPAYLADGVEVVITRVDRARTRSNSTTGAAEVVLASEKPMVSFEGSTNSEILYIRKGLETNIYVTGNLFLPSSVAAVLVYGVLGPKSSFLLSDSNAIVSANAPRVPNYYSGPPGTYAASWS